LNLLTRYCHFAGVTGSGRPKIEGQSSPCDSIPELETNVREKGRGD